jgi:oligopeptidase A
LAKKARPSAEKDLVELTSFTIKEYDKAQLEPWDIAYYSEKLKQKNYEVSQEALRPYFTAPKVQQGLFKLAETLFGVEIVAASAPDLWHPDVQFFSIKKNGETLAGFYLDLYTRQGKRGGAWMDVCLTRRKNKDELQLPVAYLVCNFNPPFENKPALLTHNDVTTLFHEFGHGLHHMLTQMDVAAVSGINGVEWDAVELPSQFLENWAWQPEVLKNITEHVDTGETIPDSLIEKMISAKNFQSGLFLLRQIEFGLFDILLHRDFGTEKFVSVQHTLDEVRKQIALIQPPSYNRFQNGFSHIFSGGYAAGYYSYLWAEVLSADAFSAFEEGGIFSSELGEKFLKNILSQGGSKPAATLFESFRGRAPDQNALLKHSAIL